MKSTIGTVARRAGVNVETIRYYERRGLIERPPTAEGQAYRHYPLETVARIQFIRKAQASGFSLREIRDLLLLDRQEGADCRDVRTRAETKIETISAKIDELVRIREALERVVADCPGRGKALADCSILEAFRSGLPHGDRLEDRSS